MRNLHQILLQEHGVEAQHLFRDWERLQLRASDYKNHRIFTLRCLHKDLIPVSIKLKSTLKTVKARQIIRKAERDLLQARVKAINRILDNVAKQTEECRTQLASIILAQRLRECQGLIAKVREIRFTKVRQRQLNKYNMPLNKKEGNITRANATNLTYSNNLGSQAGRQASTSLPPREGINPSQTGRQAGALLPSGEVSNSSPTGSQAGALLPYREGSSSSQAIAHLPPGEGSNSSQAASQSGDLLPSREGSRSSSNSPLAIAHLPPSEGSNSPPATAHLPSGEGSSSSQAIAHLPSHKGSNPPPAIAHLPPSEGSNSPPGIAHLPSGEGSSPSHATAHLPLREGNSILQATAHQSPGEGNSSPQAGQLSNQARSVRQGLRHSTRHRTPQASQENSTISQEDNPTTTSPAGFNKGLLMKNLTLSGSLTFPTNP